MVHLRSLIIKDLCSTCRVGGSLRAVLFLSAFLFFFIPVTQAQLSITSFNTAYTQNFDGLGPAPLITTKDTLPSTWGFKLAPRALNTQDWNAAGDTTSRAGGTSGAGILTSSSRGAVYNFANGENSVSTDRAIGFLHSSSFTAPSYILLRFDNNTGSVIQSLYVSFDYEKYRSGFRAWTWQFIHGSTSNPVTDTVSAGYHFYAGDSSNANVFNPPLSVSKGFFLPNLNIPAGGSYYFKWVLTGVGGSSSAQALGLDNFCLTAFSTPGISCTPPVSAAVFPVPAPATTTTTANVQFTPPPGTNSIVIASTTLNPVPLPVSGVIYNANSSYGSGSRLGNGFVVYSGSASSVTVTNLNPDTKYYFYVYSYNTVSLGSPCVPASLPCYNTSVSSPTKYIDSANTTSATVDMRSWKFRTKGASGTRVSGAWTNISIWQAQNPATFLWEAANTAPNEISSEILIAVGDTVTINSSVSMDSLLLKGILRVRTGGVVNLKNGSAEFDMRIDSGGVFRIDSAGDYSATMLNDVGARINVADSGKITIGNGNPTTVGAAYGSFGFISGFVNWSHNSVFEWNTNQAFASAGAEYFPDTTAGVIPIFRLSRGTAQIGAATPTAIYGLFQSFAAVTFGGSGVKVFRNGIINTQTLTRVQNSGQFQINGDQAIFGGSGGIAVSPATPDTGILFSEGRTLLLSNKNIGCKIYISGTFDADTFTITGFSNLIQITGTFNTRNPRGFHGLSNTSISSIISGANIKFPINPATGLRGTVDYVSSLPQTISSIGTSGVAPYGNLASTGSGSRTYTKARKIQIEGDFNPGTASYVADSTIIEFMKPRTGNDTIQNIPGFNYYNLLLSGTATKITTGTSSVPVTVMDSLKLSANTRLDLSSDLVLRSTASTTARIGVFENGSSINYTGGFFIVERYVKAGRNWQLLAAPIAPSGSQTIKDAWMEGAGSITSNPKPGYGTVITDNRSNWLSLGFDGLSPGGPSVKRYNAATQNYDNLVGTSEPISNDYGYFLFVRGDRSCVPGNTNEAPTVLRMKGRLWGASKGTVVQDSGFICVGNPFASAIDFSKVRLSNSASPVSSFYLWDPQMAGGYGVGTFVTFNYDQTLRRYDAAPSSPSFGSINSRIESGQAFFIRLSDQVAGRQLRFLDSCKVTGSNNFYRPGPSGDADQLRLNLKYAKDSLEEPVLMDGCLISFNSINNDQVDEHDAIKFANMSENLAIRKGSLLLAIERRRSVRISDTIDIQIGPYRYSEYNLEVDASSWQLANGMRAYLFDRYRNSYTDLPKGEVTNYKIITDASQASRSERRFSIVFSRPGRFFQASATLSSSNVIKSSLPIKKDKINNSQLTIFPNPVSEDLFYVDAENAGSGFFLAWILNSSGQLVHSLPLSFINNRAVVRLRGNLQTGSYRLVLISSNGLSLNSGHFLVK